MDKEEQLKQQRERYRIRKEKRTNNQKINNAGRPANTPEVLWSKIDVKTEDECWNWKGYKNEDGYGRTWINDCGYYAHRVIYDLVYPNIITLSAPKNTDETGFILHTCDNPSCCNPKHLWVGNCSENIADKVKKGRSADFSGDKGPNCKLSMAQAQEIRQKRKDGISTKELANQYGVSLSSIKTLLAGKSYVPRE
jgi:hypothetical protein